MLAERLIAFAHSPTPQRNVLGFSKTSTLCFLARVHSEEVASTRVVRINE